jgi:ABC-type sugar transport system ATPase subunit
MTLDAADLDPAAPTAPAALTLTNVSKRYPGVQALDSVTLSIKPGEIHGLVGENGAGKSTIVNLLAGAVSLDSGTIAVHGNVVDGLDPSKSMHLGISVSHQEIRLATNLSVAENILFGALPTRFGTIRRAEMRALASVALLDIGADIDPRAIVGDLSLAHQQMVEIARAVRLATSVLVLDEPTAAQSAQDATKLLEAIGRLRQRGIAVIYVSHRLEEVLDVCDRVTVLRDGKWVADRDCSQTNQDELVRLMVGRDVAELFPKKVSKPGRTMLRAMGLRGDGVADGVSMDIRAGEIVGIFGLIGAGRSEFVRLIAGVEPLRAGVIEIDGHVVSYASPAGAMRRGIAFVPEDRKGEGLVLNFSVAENLALPNYRQIREEYSLGRAGLAAFAQDQIRLVDIRPADPNREVATLSGGNQQKTTIGKWLSRRPRLLIVDEPTRGVDVGAKAQIYSLLVKLASEGMAIMMVSSELPEVLGLSDRVVVFHQGRIAGELSGDKAVPENVMHLALGNEALAS